MKCENISKSILTALYNRLWQFSNIRAIVEITQILN